MKSFSIRGMDEQLERRLKAAAKANQTSVNQLVLDLLKQQLGLIKAKKYTAQYDDLDGLFGCWTEDEAEKIQGKIDQERTIDEELWK